MPTKQRVLRIVESVWPDVNGNIREKYMRGDEHANLADKLHEVVQIPLMVFGLPYSFV
jgi:hypothetical protein